MQIQTSIRTAPNKAAIPQTTNPKSNESQEPADTFSQAYEKYDGLLQASRKYAPLRTGASIAAGVVGMAAAGYFLGGTTGLTGRLVGAAIGTAAGVTGGGLAGSVVSDLLHAREGGLAYLGMGVVGGGAVGLVAGAVLGASASPILGAVAGAAGGLGIGFIGGQMIEDKIEQGLRREAGLP